MKNLYLFTEKSPTSSNSAGGMLKFSSIIDIKSQEIVRKKNITKPYQFFGLWIAENLGEYKHLPLYIKLAKYQQRGLLEQAVSYIKDYPNAKSKHNLFMWYLKGKLKGMKSEKVKVKKNKQKSLL